MSDIVERLRNWRNVHLTQLRYVMESAADEIERLRLSTNGDFPEPENATNEDRALTAAERLVLRQVCDEYADEDDVRCNEIAYVIDRILERTKSNDNTQDGATPSPASAGYGEVELMRKASRKMDIVLVSTAYFIQKAMEWLRKTHVRVRIEFTGPCWCVEPLNDELEWTGRDGGQGASVHAALANAVCNYRKP